MKYFIFLTLLVVNTLNACAVCYGAPDDPITKSLNSAIIFLLCTVFFVLSCIIYGIISMIKKTNKIKGV